MPFLTSIFAGPTGAAEVVDAVVVVGFGVVVVVGSGVVVVGSGVVVISSVVVVSVVVVSGVVVVVSVAELLVVPAAVELWVGDVSVLLWLAIEFSVLLLASSMFEPHLVSITVVPVMTSTSTSRPPTCLMRYLFRCINDFLRGRCGTCISVWASVSAAFSVSILLFSLLISFIVFPFAVPRWTVD